jgi:formylglycine-generating enzyme required for sulfatase activity
MMNPRTNISNPFRRTLAWLMVSIFACFFQQVKANNLQISNVVVIGPNTTLHFALVRFNINWENSWRTSAGPANWDAAWVFIKYRITSQQTWRHATLNWINGSGIGDGHVVPSTATIASSNDNGGGGSYGVFIYHNTDMPQSAVSYSDVQLRWNYGIDGVSDTAKVEICVMGIEMVRVPQGSYMLGDGTTGSVAGQFHNASGVTNPFQVTSENALTMGGGSPGSLGNNNGTNMLLVQDDFNDVTSQILPASFPKGFMAFYCMKYEITQEQYVMFLNRLNYNQQATRTNLPTPPNAAIGTNVLTFFGSPFRNGIVIMTPGIQPGTPAVYACNENGNGTFNEADDGQNIACNNLSWADISAYFDWAALRPMTELEYEKACRGSETPVAEEYAWGNTGMNLVPGIINNGMTNEISNDPNANCNNTDWTAMSGPVRVGSLGTGINTRQATGASYYGIMEMSGNLWERAVTVGNAAGRAFNGMHGNGVISNVFVLGQLNIGDADVLNWPGNTALGSGFRGGAWYFFDPQAACISNRLYAASDQPFPLYDFGGRGVRTAPY